MSYETHQKVLNDINQFMEEHNPHVRTSKWREHYHFMMPTGWINDPCGLVCADGTYHMFCQHQPYKGTWGQMFWGHSTSRDMIHWEKPEEGIAPSEDYDGWTGGGIFTGSAIYEDNEIKVFYTGCSEARQVQCMATSKDGVHFVKSEHNPIIPKAPEGTNPHDFRDPKVWKHGDWYYMVTGGTRGVSALLDESTYAKNGYGRVFLHRSQDLIHWEFVNDLVESRGELGTMLECPNFFPMDDDTFVLIYSPMGMPQRKTIYLTGKFNYDIGKFNWNVMGEVDWGYDYYAPQVFTDHTGRTLMFGWIGSWPFMPWNHLKYDTSEDGWAGSISLPRVLTLCPDGKLKFEPAQEVKSLRTDCVRNYAGQILENGVPFFYDAGADNVHCEIEVELEMEPSVSQVVFELRQVGENSTRFILDRKAGELVFDRSRAGNIENGVRRCNFESAGENRVRIHAFLDSCSMEIFADDGRTVMTNNVFSAEGETRLSVTSLGGRTALTEFNTYGMDKVISW